MQKHDNSNRPIRGDLATEIRDPKRRDIGDLGVKMVEAARRAERTTRLWAHDAKP